MSEATITKFFREKNNGTYTKSPAYFGTEQRFISPLRNSNSNNLEEQFLLGTDCLVSAWLENDNLHIKKEYFVQDTGDDSAQKISSYIIHTIIYGETAIHNEDYYFDGENIKVSNKGVDFAEDIFTIDTDQAYYYLKDSLAIYPDKFVLVREDRLQYVSKDGTIVDVSTKYTSRKSSQDGKFLYTQKKIVNHLKGEVKGDGNS